MNTRSEVLRIMYDTSAPEHTTVTLHYASDEPAHPVWGGGVKQKTFPASIPTEQLWQQVFGDTGVAYINWPDAPPAVAAWFTQQPGLSAFVGHEPARFDRTSPADAADVARARAAFHKYGTAESQNKVVVSLAPDLPRLPINGPEPTAEQLQRRLAIRHVTFERHDVLAPWVATHITPLPAAPGAEPVLPFTHPTATDAQH